MREKRCEPPVIILFRIGVGGEIARQRLTSVGHAHPFHVTKPQCSEHDDRASLQPEADQLPEVIILLSTEVNRLRIRDERVPIADTLEVFTDVRKVWLFHDD